MTNTVEKLHLNADVAFFGNSITRGSEFEKLFESDSLLIVNLGYSGDNIPGMIRRIDMLQACHPRKVFLMAGTNGLKDQSLTEFQTLYTQLVDSIHTRLPQSQVYLQSILPVNHEYAEPDMRKGFASNEKILDANRIIRKIAKQKNITYINLHHLYLESGMMAERYTRDGIHLKPEAYQLWADEIHKYVVEE